MDSPSGFNFRDLPNEANKWKNINGHIFGTFKLKYIEIKDKRNKSTLKRFVKMINLCCLRKSQ